MRHLPFLLALFVLLAPGQWAAAQVPTGNGLRGDYYEGRNFERYVGSRRDATLDFNWHGKSPGAGLPAVDFSVRWTGWLVPPATGEYVLQVAVDDGARLWLNGRQLLNEWRGQREAYYQVAVPLQAGHAYRLRLDYTQYGWDTRLRLSWRPPTAAATLNPLGLPNGGEPTTAIPTRYLFTQNPSPPAPPKPPVAAAPPPRPMPTVPLATVAVRGRPAAPRPRPVPRQVVLPVASRAAELGAQLASGQALTLRTLYFEQGQAFLLPAVQASLDTLADALRQRTTLRLQVQGHTDNQGDSVLNRQLSQRRAEAVCRYLAAHGVAAGRLHPRGLGGRHPVADNSVPAERPRNRRVVLVRE